MSHTVSGPARLLTPSQNTELWDAFVMEHPKGTVFHTSAMIRAFSATPKNEPFAIAARDGRGNIVALLIAVRVSVLPGLASWLSSRSIMYAEPLVVPTEEGTEALKALVRHHDREMRLSTLFAEVRPIGAPANEREVLQEHGYEFQDYLNYVLDTSPDVEILWKNLGKSTRQKIRRSHRRGVKVELYSTHAAIDRMYAITSHSYRRSQLPLIDVNLFHAAQDHLPNGVVQVRVATYQGRDVAAGIGLMFRNRFYAWYGGTLRVPGIAPFDCLTWDEIRWASEHGGRYYDFGGAGTPDETYGPRDFKAKFRGELVRLGRYRRVYSPFRLSLASNAFRLLRGSVSPRQPYK